MIPFHPSSVFVTFGLVANEGPERIAMKRAIVLVALAALVFTATPSRAVIGTIDDVPASTLLLPYFEVDLEHSSGVNTLFSINNASASAAVAHVTVWTDWSFPTLDFDVYLTGFDVQTINLRIRANPREGYRTFSHQRLAGRAGQWEVSLLGDDGSVVASRQFTVASQGDRR